jgi:hypothetical protein
VAFVDGGGDVEGCRVEFGQNSHSQNLPGSFLGKRSLGWYIGHKKYNY